MRNTFEISNEHSYMLAEFTPDSKKPLSITLEIENYCTDNNYNGDNASIDLTLVQALALKDFLINVLP